MQPDESSSIVFRFKSAYMGEIDYSADYNGQSIGIRVLEKLVDYRREVYNGGPTAFDREVAPALHCAWLHNSAFTEPPFELISALNAFRTAEHAEALAKLASQPERYGVIGPDDTFRIPPPTIHGAHLDSANHWEISRPPPIPGDTAPVVDLRNFFLPSAF